MEGCWKLKFEEAFCSQNHRYYSVDEITAIYLKEPDVFASLYRNNLFCPGCQKAKLSYNNASIPYLKSYPNAEHTDSCDLRQSEMSSDDAYAFSQDPASQEVIQRQMQSILQNLLAMSSTGGSIAHQKICNGKSGSKTAALNTVTRKRLARKRIDMPMREEDYDCVKCFYGPVIFRWEKDAQTGKMKILLRHQITKRFLGKLKVSKDVYDHIADNIKGTKEFRCNIVFVAIAEKRSDGRYFTATLRHSTHLLLSKT